MAENNNDQLLQAKARLAEFLKKQKMRRTPERLAILEKAYSTGKHFFADELYGILENDGYHVSRSTLYASLQVLVDAGLLLRHQFGNQPAQYERVPQGISESHHHLVCNTCGKVRAVKDPGLIATIGNIRYPSFKTDFFSLYVYGTCSRCQKKLRREKSEQKKTVRPQPAKKRGRPRKDS